MMLNKIFNKTYIFLFIFLVACSSSAKQNTQKNKIFELDLTNEQISTEGGTIELKKIGSNCSLVLNLYNESGQESYDFQFKANDLIKASHLIYRYKNGLLVTDDDLKDLIADNNTVSNSNDIELVSKEYFIGNKNKSISKTFKIYKKKIPNSILIKNCN
ncbi:hypothetical protein F9230_16525 [Acinetobacter johnsonii]|nr:hypothetical protein F9230_16525 [Acinetobacter johnsonii]